MNLVEAYVNAGIIQFGRFEDEQGGFAPVTLNFLLLPSFPRLLYATAQALAPLVGQPERLLTTRAAVPLGALVAVARDIPLTYPYGEDKSYTQAFVIEGAYDVGHPTTLISYTLPDPAALALPEMARRVGLVVDRVVCLFALGDWHGQGVTVQPLFDLSAALDDITTLPVPMRAHVRAWLGEQPKT